MTTKVRRKGTFTTAIQERLSPELFDALKQVGGVYNVARACGVAVATVYDWLSGRTRPGSVAFSRVERYLLVHTGILLSFELAPDSQPEPLLTPLCSRRESYQIEDALIRRLDVQLALRRMRERGQNDLAELITKRYLIGMTFVEVGNEQETSFQAVQQRDHKARLVLRKMLAPYQVPSQKNNYKAASSQLSVISKSRSTDRVI